jgi:hypothetical protein
MRKRDQANLDAASLDELVEEITVDANGEDEQLWAFRQAFEDNVSVPCEATVIGEPVKVMKFDYDGNNRRGLTAMCRRADGTNYVVAASDLVIPLSASGGRHLAAYRKWMGLAPLPRGTRGRTVQQTAVAPQISTVPSNWWSCRSNRSLRAAACWVATEPSLSELAGSGTYCPERSRSYGPRSSGFMRAIPISPA